MTRKRMRGQDPMVTCTLKSDIRSVCICSEPRGTNRSYSLNPVLP